MLSIRGPQATRALSWKDDPSVVFPVLISARVVAISRIEAHAFQGGLRCSLGGPLLFFWGGPVEELFGGCRANNKLHWATLSTATLTLQGSCSQRWIPGSGAEFDGSVGPSFRRA